MKKSNGLWIGLIFILIGVLYAGNALRIFDFSIFFPGWWTLFIILPCIYALCKKGEDKTGPVIGLVIGLCFLINAQDFSFHIDFWPMLIAVLCIVIGVKMMFPQNKRRNEEEYGYTYDNVMGEEKGDTAFGYGNSNAGVENGNRSQKGFSNYGNGYLNVSAILGGKDIRVDNECFTGADITAIMGGVDIDLRSAIISEDVYINITAIMGGVDIAVPANVRIVSDGCNAIMGGVDVNTAYVNHPGPDAPRVIITGTCIMGGVDVK